MKNYTKRILAISTLVVGLAGPATAALSETGADSGADNPGVTTGFIEALISQYAGLAPGDPDFHNLEPRHVPKSQHLSTFTRAAGPMSSYFTISGVDKDSAYQPSNQADSFGSGSGGSGSNTSASAPAITAITLARYAQDTLVGAVASSIAVTSSSGGYSAPQGNILVTPPKTHQITTTIVPIPQSETVITTTITPIATPIPPDRKSVV